MTLFTKRIAFGVGVVALALGAGAAGFAAAQDGGGNSGGRHFMHGGPGGPGGPRGFMGRGGPGGPLGGFMFGPLDLTDAQEEQVRTILETRRASNEPLMERAQTARAALHEAIATQPVDEGMIRARSADLASVEADLAVARAQVQAEIMGLLTDEQKAELAEMRENRSERMEDRREWMRERGGR
ncbi:MAG: Spy/CpxP family protein refolding chaperone [Vicinamibacterales bacterium]